MKFTVLGSEGQIGKELTNYLTQQGHQVYPFDIRNAEYQDLRIDYTADACIKDSDFVFFMAFDVGGSQYLKKYQSTFEFVDNNVRIMTNTFRALHELKKPFLFASTQMSNMNFSSYGTLKAIGEHYCRTLNSPIVKFWNVYGVETDPDKTHVITDFVKMALDGKPITMRTDGQEERQFLYVRDCCEALFKMYQQYDFISRSEEYHITSFNWDSILHVANLISEMCGNVPIVPAEAKDTVQKDQRNEPNAYIKDSGLWTPTTTLSQGLSRIIEYEKLHATH